MEKLHLQFGITFDDLYSHAGLSKLDAAFNEFIKSEDKSVEENFNMIRSKELTSKEYSQLIVSSAPYVEKFISNLFSIEKYLEPLNAVYDDFDVIHKCKRLFVQRRALRDYNSLELTQVELSMLVKSVGKILNGVFTELSFANSAMLFLEEQDKYAEELDIFSKFAAWAVLSREGRKRYSDWVLFDIPKKRDNGYSLDLEKVTSDHIDVLRSPEDALEQRDGFSLTSKAYGAKEVLDQASYCIHCHKTQRDSCAKGIKEKNEGSGEFVDKLDSHGQKLSGCPLDEKISEMNFLKTQNKHIAALAAATIDNPMLAATGHRICNDCMRSCIYQKQDPVQIPKIETGVLSDILNLPWGFEIYRLLTQWNPLKIGSDYIAKKNTGARVLVAGLGPAGFTLAHYLLIEGHNVVGIDGLKIEPLEEKLSGIDAKGNRATFYPIKNINEIFEDLDDRIPYGFGGVAEYGITSRWNKNFLKVIRLILERHPNFRMFGGVRFGSNIDYNSAFELGFDHIALSMGAGRPNLLEIPNALALGVRTASDFLMGLQLTGAAQKSSIANLQIRLPVVVIGAGLTAIDTATEALSYYIRQVEKFYNRYLKLVSVLGEKSVQESWSLLDKEIAAEFIEHAKLFEEERKNAESENRKPNFIKIVQKFGGVKVMYRRKLQDSPSYKLNPEELECAFKEGIEFIENAVIKEVNLDSKQYIRSITADVQGIARSINAKTLLIAMGTNPNTSLNNEDPENFVLDKKYFKLVGDGVFLGDANGSKNNVSIFGDLHQKYKGNVVKAMASAKDNYKAISNILPSSGLDNTQFFDELKNELVATVYSAQELAPNIVEVVFNAPMAAKAFKPGQFYKLQNYNKFAFKPELGNDKTNLLMEGLALTGAWVDKKQGLISTIVLEMGGSSDLCRFLKKGEPVILMGPTGSPTKITSDETVLLAGGGLGNAVLFSIGKAFRDAGSRVLYFAGYKKAADRYKISEIEAAADQVVWCCDEKSLQKSRPEDITFHGNIAQAILKYSNNGFGSEKFNVGDVDRIISIGSSGMMEAVENVRKHQLIKKMKDNHASIASINSPMQCMMKEVCAQCLQKHINPVTGMETYVYSCMNQDQNTSSVDFSHLNARLSQNSLSEKLTAKWVDYNLQYDGLREGLKTCEEV